LRGFQLFIDADLPCITVINASMMPKVIV